MATVRGCVTVDDERKQLLHDRYHDFRWRSSPYAVLLLETSAKAEAT